MGENKCLSGKKNFLISDLFWERVFLHFTIETTDLEEAFFALKSLTTQEIIPLNVEKKEEGCYYFCLNITAANVRSFLENGHWTIAFRLSGEDSYQPCFVTAELGYKLDELTRVFRYGEDKYAYTMDFTVFSEDQVNLVLMIKSYFMKTNAKWRKRPYVYRSNEGKFFRKVLRRLAPIWIRGINIWYRFVGMFRKRNKVNLLLMNETNALNAGNLQIIDDCLKKRGLYEEINVSHSFRKALGGNASILSWVKLVSKIALQDIIIVDNYVPIFSFLKLRKDVELIQVWHAGGGFKAVGYCRFGKEGSPFPEGSCHKAYTTAVTGSKQLIKVFEEVFGIEKEAFYPVGMPRLDGYLDQNKIESFREGFYKTYPLFKNKKIILFAPTYRGVGQKTAYYDYDKIDLEQIYNVCGDEFVFLVKMHPFIKEPLEIPEKYRDRIFDFSAFSSINDLFYVTEVLITDYSSNFYEYALMRKPMLFYTYDRHIYELTRGVYRGVKESAPGKVCDTFEELIEALKNKDYEYEKVIAFVEENFADAAGQASDKLIDNIILKKRDNIKNDSHSN